MDLIKISLFLALIAFAQCNTNEPDVIGTDSDLVDETTENHEKSDNEPEDNRDATEERNETKEQENVTPSRRFLPILPIKQCPCFPGSLNGIPVSHHLNPRPGTNYERLVVYFFRNRATNEIKIYIPNIARQIVFPDITYSNGDVLNHLNQNAFEIISNNLGPVVKSWITVVKRQPHHNLDINLEILSNVSKEKANALLLFLRRYKDTKKILGTLKGFTLHDKLKELKKLYPKIYKGYISKITKFYPVWLNRGRAIRYLPGQLINFPYDIKLIPVLQRNHLIVNGKPIFNVNEIIIYKPPNIDTSDFHPVLNSGITFDRWFSIFVNRLNSQLQFASKAINGVALKSLIIEILNKKGLSISQNGYLLDTSAKRVRWSNIILRPILIGESYIINSIINNGLFKIPTDIVFIEVLIVSGGQSRSLGIIPIGKIFVSEKQVEVSTVVEVVETTVTCEGGVCRKEKRCKNLDGNVTPCQNLDRSGNNENVQSRQAEDINEDAVTETSSRSGELRSGLLDPCIGPGCDYGAESQSRVSPDMLDILNKAAYYRDGPVDPDFPFWIPRLGSGNAIEIGRSGGTPPIHIPDDDLYRGRSGAKKSLIYLNALNEYPRASIEPGVIAHHKQSEPPVHIQASDEVPGIRIVGGGPATSSGTPVNSKGRSGIPDLISEYNE